MTCPACLKTDRAVWYCHRPAGECGLRRGYAPVAAIIIPRPDVTVTHTDDGKSHVVISRDGRGKSYEVNGTTPDEKVKDAVEKVLNDSYTGEWLP